MVGSHPSVKTGRKLKKYDSFLRASTIFHGESHKPLFTVFRTILFGALGLHNRLLIMDKNKQLYFPALGGNTIAKMLCEKKPKSVP